MIFKFASFLLSMFVLSLNLAISLSFLNGGGAPFRFVLSPGHKVAHGFHSHRYSTRQSASRPFTHLSYKSKPYHDGAETDTAPTPTTAAQKDEHGQDLESSPVASPPQEPKHSKKKRSRVVKSSVNDSKVRVVTTLKEFYKCFEEEYEAYANKGSSKTQQERVVIVRFFSHWCKSCAAIAPKYNRLARLYPNNVFIDIPVTRENIDLQKALGIKAVPFGHIYYPKLQHTNINKSTEEDCDKITLDEKDSFSTRDYDRFYLMEELKMGKMFWSDFEDIFHSYMKGSCTVAGMDYNDPIASSGSTIREYMNPNASHAVDI
mmetsp:Transcript_3572/g.4140  ORF Transcript_3572/g.4140 Transcript_3572/m.4140 type:complete len:318 (+) Transcript_3572:152-1105(+)|eukprot:CAMPEP_0204647558 /NCGR_PEP_ID=MMETSP0718-20130828/6357_1 /ASSEMBLY_ACC=CAM_ASM_000674 /TAXON_ID=230516 /ORGANISM="Chaetoceros curvisetus" /LENGTH=317 /DNA_ID=CAMNT_0051670159 /DNA_START=47 /DNA_END=1000 /DNA_ORIENTATION=-